jgi:protein-S-isoprenylcysteine O-methyltransferase Ste14
LTLLYPVWAVLLMFISCLIAFFGRACREEAALSERFGEQWGEYKRHTKFLIPFIY